MDLSSLVERAQVDEGWWGGYFGAVQLCHYGPKVNAAGFERYLKFMTDEIDNMVAGQRIAIFYDCPKPSGMQTEERKRVAQALADRREKLRKNVTGYVMVTESLLVRSIVQTVFFFSRPPYPTSVTERPLAGFQALAKHMPGLDPPALAKRYEQATKLFYARSAAA
jgi:hypothetical protein